MLPQITVKTMDLTNFSSDTTNIFNVTIYVHLKALKLCYVPSRYGISSHPVQISLKYLQVYQDFRLKENLHKIIEDNINLQTYHS